MNPIIARLKRMNWNPLACSDTPLRPNALLTAKLAWLLLVLGGYGGFLNGPYTPSAGLLDAVPGSEVLLPISFWFGGISLLFNRGVRVACTIVGGAVLLGPLQSLPAWHPHAWVCGGVILLCALQTSAGGPQFVRGFMILVHLTALLDASRGADWVSSAFAAPWSAGDYTGSIPRWLAQHFAPGSLPGFLKGATLAICAVIPAGLLVPRLRGYAAWTALIFYTSLYLALGSKEVALFAGAIAIGQISFLEWPHYILVVWPRSCGWPVWLRSALDRYDFERRTDWPRPADPDARLEASFDGRAMAGAKAVVSLTLFFPVFYFAALAVFVSIHAVLPRFVAVPCNVALALSLLGFALFGWVVSVGARFARRPSSARSAAPAAASVADEIVDETTTPGPEVTTEIDIPPPPGR